MKFICDMDFSPAVAEGLRDHGHDALAVTDVLPPSTPDEDLLEHARSEQCVLVTFDRGIPPRLARTGAAGPSVINLIMADRRAEAVVPVLLEIIAEHGPALQCGAMVIYKETATRQIKRVRPLPMSAGS